MVIEKHKPQEDGVLLGVIDFALRAESEYV